MRLKKDQVDRLFRFFTSFLWLSSLILLGSETLVAKNSFSVEEIQTKKRETNQGVTVILGENNLAQKKANNNEVREELGLKWGGYLWLDHRLFTRSPRNYSFKEYRLELQAEAKTEKTRFASTLWVRSLGFSVVKDSRDLFVRKKISPLEVEIREAYVDLYSFLFPWLDLRIGRQRIAWGTADKVNPTDNLNPDDLEDIWDFGRHLGSDAVRATCYFGQFTLTGVFIPNFTPASPPLPDWAEAFMPPLELNGLNITGVRDEIILPENSLQSSSVLGLKIGSKIKGYDFSFSFVRGRDDLPLLRDIIVEKSNGLGLNVLARLVYPRLNILGFDLAGAIGGIGLWAEGALFFPERVIGETFYPVPGYGWVKQSRIALDNEAYTKFVFGADYTFPNGIYLNGQFAHGFLHERGASELGDYFLFNLEWRFLRDKLKLVPLAGCIEISEWRQFKDNLALILVPSVEYHPAANAEIVTGLRIISGREGTSFGRIKNRDEIFLRFKYSF
ncbi:MAG: hypothetical protein N3B16_00865 [Candidatus Aminicenantes bacterium]|nr:hypothetical protein [Candidatus Aminicenantes bacterium]